MTEKQKKRHGSIRVPGGSSLAASQFVAAAFADIEHIASKSTAVRLKCRWDLHSQLADITSGLFRLASQKKNRAAARWATEELVSITVSCTNCLRQIATRNQPNTSERESAGVGLALVYASLGKYDSELTKRNPAYCKRKSALTKQRKDVVAATGLIATTVRDELNKACKYRAELLVLRRLHIGTKWRVKPDTDDRTQPEKPAGKARRWVPPLSVSKEYEVTLELEPLSVKTAPKWFKRIIWPQIKRRSRELLPKLRARSKRVKRVDVGDGESKIIRRRLYLTDYYAEFRNAFLSLVRSSTTGTSKAKLQR
jgi:hypothetical protein